MKSAKIHIILLLSLLIGNIAVAQTKTAITSGNWSSASVWSPAGVPNSSNNVVIQDGVSITLDISANCNSLTIGNGGNASALRFSGNTDLTLNVNSSLLITGNGSIKVRSSSNATHTLSIKGNLTNNGTLDLSRDANSICELIFTNNGSQVFDGTGTTTNLYSIVLNMGTSNTNVLDIRSSVLTAPAGFLTLNNGCFKISSTSALSLVPFTSSATIPASSGIWLNGASCVLSASAGIALAGKIQLGNGTLNIGNASDEDLYCNGGSVSISGGTMNIAGKYYTSNASNSFSMSGGYLSLPNIGSSNTTIAPFHNSGTNSVFNMSGGTLNIQREGGNGTQDLGFINTGSVAGAISGGTLQLGSALSPANQTISINSLYSVPNLSIASASVFAKLATNSLTVLKDISISSGTLSSTNLAISLGGNWTSAGTFSPGTGTVTFNSAAAQTISRSGGETFYHLQFSGTGIKSLFSPLVVSGNFSISAGTTVDVNSGNQQISLKGNFLNNGDFKSRNGLVLFNGTSAQTIGGSSTSDFYDLTLNNNSGAVLNSSQNILNTLSLLNGTLSVNAQSLTLVSSATNTARISQIMGTGNIVGNVTLQRYVPGGTTGWGLIGAPVSSGLTFSDWDDDLFISCATCPDGSAAGFISIYAYDESAPGVYDAAASYVPMTAISNSITEGKAYWVYLGTSQYTSTGITMDVTGSVRKFNYSIPLKYTNTGSAANDGWNLISNPYPSAVSWSTLKGSTSNLDNAIYVYNADLNSGTGGFASYVNGISSPAVASGGQGDVIAMSQGFFVHATAATTINATETAKTSSNTNFLRPANSPTNTLVRLNLASTTGSNDETVIYTQTGASQNFETQFDAYKMRGQDPAAPFFASETGNELYQVNAIAPISGTVNIPLKVLTGYTGTYTISLSELNNAPQNMCISIYDKFTGNVTDIKNGYLIFSLADTTSISRFVLSIVSNTLNFSTAVTMPVCSDPNSGKIIATPAGNGPWTYTWKTNGQTSRTSSLKNTADTLYQVNGGNIYVEVSAPASCAASQNTLTLSTLIVPTASITSLDTLYLDQADTLRFNNSSSNINFFQWSFSNSWFSIENNPLQTYKTPGTYTASILVKSSSGCTDKFSKQIHVISRTTGIEQPASNLNEILVKDLGMNIFQFEAQEEITESFELSLMDLEGKELESTGKLNNTKLQHTFDLNKYSAGIYLVRILMNDQKTTFKLLAK